MMHGASAVQRRTEWSLPVAGGRIISPIQFSFGLNGPTEFAYSVAFEPGTGLGIMDWGIME